MRAMSLARVWRRQLLGASTAALIVPFAMFAALLVLAIGGAFSGVGVLGQLFAGPSLAGVPGVPSGAGGPSGGARGLGRVVTTASLPVIPAVVPVAARRPAPARGPASRTVPAASHRGVGAGGGAIAPVGGTVRPVTQGSGSGGSSGGQGSAPGRGPAPAPAPAPAPVPPAPQPSPPPRTTPVDTVVTVVTSVTQEVPAPVGPVATHLVQAAGSAADNLLPGSGQSVP
jgi:hypothetical protein